MKDSKDTLIRPILPEDERKLSAFHKELSAESVRQRYLASLSLDERVSHQRLARICFCDWEREIAIVAEIKDSIAGVARLSRLPGTANGQIRMIIADAWHGKGLGTKLMEHLIVIAQKECYTSIRALVLEENTGMLAILKKLHFTLERVPETPFYRAERKL